MNDKTSSRPDFSGIRSGSSSTAPSSRTEGTTPQTGTRTYVVVKGDSLSKIAQREYGDAQQWRRIFDANRDIIQDPDLIHPGQTLRLP
jgi:nucleoid-associated protein YgaU